MKAFLTWVSAYPPDRGRLSEYAEALLESLSSLLPSKIVVLSDCSSKKYMPLIEVKPVWRPDKPLSILKLWIRILTSKSKIIHFNLHLAVFGRSRLVNFLGLSSTIIARLSMKKVVVTLHNIPEGVRLEVVGLKGTLLNRVGLISATKIVLSSAHVVIVPVKHYVRLLRERYHATNVVWIPHGAWFTEASPTWRWRCGKVRVLFLGYLSSYKALKTLSEAVKEVNGELLISGSPHPNFKGEGFKVLEDILKEGHVKYLGYVENSGLPKLVSNINVVVLPYLTSTGTSGVVHLLSGLGAPFIAFETREFRELMLEGAGIVLAKMSKESLKNRIVEVVGNRLLAEELSKRSRLFALDRRWSKVAKAHLKIYVSLLKNV